MKNSGPRRGQSLQAVLRKRTATAAWRSSAGQHLVQAGQQSGQFLHIAARQQRYFGLRIFCAQGGYERPGNQQVPEAAYPDQQYSARRAVVHILYSIIIDYDIHKERLGEFQDLLAENGLDAYIVSSKADQGFLTGYYMNDWVLVVGRKKAWGLLSVMLKDQFLDAAPFCGAVPTADIGACALELAAKQRLKKIAFDPSTETFAQGSFLKKKSFVEKPGLVMQLRLLKRGEEVRNLRKAGQIAAAAFLKVKPRLRPGMSERAIMLLLERTMQDMGASGPSFDTIIGSGPNSALPHHSPPTGCSKTTSRCCWILAAYTTTTARHDAHHLRGQAAQAVH